MRLSVLLFSLHRTAVGRARLMVDVDEGTTVGRLFRILQKEHPALHRLRAQTLYAVNREQSGPRRRLRDGDEVACFPPVSGG